MADNILILGNGFDLHFCLSSFLLFGLVGSTSFSSRMDNHHAFCS